MKDLQSVASLKNHPGMQVIHAKLVEMYLSALDALKASTNHESTIRAQALIEAINAISGMFEQADYVERDARRQMVEDRLKSMTTPTE